jgi:hypothetical protein
MRHLVQAITPDYWEDTLFVCDNNMLRQLSWACNNVFVDKNNLLFKKGNGAKLTLT